MNILYDHDIFTRQKFGGISKYFYELITGIVQCSEVKINLFMGMNNSGYDFSKYTDKINLSGRKIKGADKLHFLFNPVNSISFNRFSRRNRSDLFHKTYYSNNGLNQNIKKVTTIHDMTHELFPKYFAKSDNTASLKRDCIDSSDGIICVSQTTKNDLLNMYRIDDNKVKVIYHGIELSDIGGNKDIIKESYILFVGERWGYKNFSRLLTAFNLMNNLKNSFKLVCFGGGELNFSEKIYIRKNNLTDRVVYINGDDKVLSCLYKYATVLVYTSLYEGFGLPPLEAMQSGCPVLAASSDAVKEITGNAALLFDPHNLEELSSKLLTIIENKSMRNKFIELGFARSKMFSWEKSVNAHLDFYKEVLNF